MLPLRDSGATMPQFNDNGRNDRIVAFKSLDKRFHVAALQDATSFNWSWSIYRTDLDELIADSTYMFPSRDIALKVGNYIKRIECDKLRLTVKIRSSKTKLL